MPKPSGPRAKASRAASKDEEGGVKAGKQARAGASEQTELTLPSPAESGEPAASADAEHGAGPGGNGVAASGMEADDASAQLAQAGAAAPVPVQAPPSGPRELALTSEGCWKIEADGERSDLTEAQWRHELAKLLRKAPPA